MGGKYALPALLLSAWACAHPPRFVRHTPILSLLYAPDTTHYFDHRKFSFDLNKNWKGPVATDASRQFTRDRGKSALSISFFPKDSPDWKEPSDYRRHMTAQGSVDDSHLLTEVSVSSRTASRVRFTTYRYDPNTLLGEKAEDFYTELIMVPDPGGIFVIRMQAPKRRFKRVYPEYERFLESLTLAAPPVEEP